MRQLFNYFLRGLVFVAPVAITLYVCYKVFVTIDSWLGFPIPGTGFVVTIALITLVGFLGSGIVARGMLAALDHTMDRLPFVRFLYSSTRDLMNAFVGEHRRFDRPVLLDLVSGGQAQVLGFVTQQSLESFGMAERVAVYVPQSYNVAGTLILVPRDAVTPVKADSADVMAFIVSGGVTAIGTRPRRTPPPR